MDIVLYGECRCFEILTDAGFKCRRFIYDRVPLSGGSIKYLNGIAFREMI